MNLSLSLYSRDFYGDFYGLDLDSQLEPRLPTTTAAAAPNPSQILQDSPANDGLRTGEDLDYLHELERAEVEDSGVEPERLRRGPGPGPRPTTQSLSSSFSEKKKQLQLERTCSGNGDDEIEEFSSPKI
ncbi:hypothetical protein Dsin_023045 [Dipteronia sinensis]|uniref:Uncharacterized protein n=1 Tax=Dipteronia sinensis TaxID=43782 RepID=A0AAE0E0B4_9ROSI|nr:hypothetical protein Dsin_023045 [Dipteronia sinensis]